jgi:hypothetical protein
VLQVGRFERKRDAQKAIAAAMGRGRIADAPPIVDFLEDWLERFPRHPRTQATNEERIRRYILPYLPHKGHVPITNSGEHRFATSRRNFSTKAYRRRRSTVRSQASQRCFVTPSTMSFWTPIQHRAFASDRTTRG